MAKPIEEKVVATLDEILFGEVPNTAFYSNEDEYKEAQSIFDFSQKGKEFGNSFDWNEWLLPQLQINADDTARKERDYSGTDDEKSKKLRLERICADYALKFVKGLVEDAASFPRPIFKKEV